MGKIGAAPQPGGTPLEDISGLIPKTILTQEQLNLAEFANINHVMLKYFTGRIPGKRGVFGYEGLMKLHREMFGEVWRWAGRPRQTEKTVGVPAHLIGQEVHRFAYDLHLWEKQKMPVGEIAVRIHHRLVQIHPFENGNGRWARLAANIFLRQKGREPVQWPEQEVFAADRLRREYIAALKEADQNRYQPLLDLHSRFSMTDTASGGRGT